MFRLRHRVSVLEWSGPLTLKLRLLGNHIHTVSISKKGFLGHLFIVLTAASGETSGGAGMKEGASPTVCSQT